MSYALSVFLISNRALAEAVGSRDARFLRRILSEMEHELADYDRQMDAPDPDNELDITHAQAVQQIVNGDEKNAPYSRYGWAFKTICSYLGERLDNTGFSPCWSNWYDELDECLKQQNVVLRFADLIYRCPIALPSQDDWPCIGHWTREEMAAGAPLLEAALRGIDDDGKRESLTTALQWIQYAIVKPDPSRIVIGFHG